eukprot:jgi/Chlat1/7101/Chrsp57S06733
MVSCCWLCWCAAAVLSLALASVSLVMALREAQLSSALVLGAGCADTTGAVRALLGKQPAQSVSQGQLQLHTAEDGATVLAAGQLTTAAEVAAVANDLCRRKTAVDAVVIACSLADSNENVINGISRAFGERVWQKAVLVVDADSMTQEEAAEQLSALQLRIFSACSTCLRKQPPAMLSVAEDAAQLHEALTAQGADNTRFMVTKRVDLRAQRPASAAFSQFNMVMDANMRSMQSAQLCAAQVAAPKHTANIQLAPVVSAPTSCAQEVSALAVQPQFCAIASALPFASMSLASRSLGAPSAIRAPASKLKASIAQQIVKKQAPSMPSKSAGNSAVANMSSLSVKFATVSALTMDKPSFELKQANISLFNDLSLDKDSGRKSRRPPGAGGMRGAVISWFRNDLRVHDNEAFLHANEEASSVVPLYIFDPRDYGKSASGFDKTGPYRAKFLRECVSDLRASLQQHGTDLVVRIGKPEEVLADIAKQVGAEAVYTHQEVTREDVQAEEQVQAVLKKIGVEFKASWGSTLYHLDDLPFKLNDMPSNYGAFREQVQNVAIRKTVPVAELKRLPAQGSLELGDIPTLDQLGLSSTSVGQQRKLTLGSMLYQDTAGAPSLIGGEKEALERLRTFVADAVSAMRGAKDSLAADKQYGANFSCKISPWLAMGCLSPRRMYEDLKAAGGAVASSAEDSNRGGLNWLVFELLWRDFFR